MYWYGQDLLIRPTPETDQGGQAERRVNGVSGLFQFQRPITTSRPPCDYIDGMVGLSVG